MLRPQEKYASLCSEISAEEKKLLDEQGYLVIEDVLDADQLTRIKDRILQLQREEGIRCGDVRTSFYRARLQKSSRITDKLKLRFIDTAFIVLRGIIDFFRKRWGRVNEMLWLYSLQPENSMLFKEGLRNEFKQMMMNITQQQEKDVDRLCNLVNKGEEFDVFYQHPKVMSAVKHIVGKNLKLSSLNLRSPRKDSPTQPMHVDWPWKLNTDKYYASNTLWALDDVDLNNGPTRVVPGSHLNPNYPVEEMEDIYAKHPDEIYITAKAGSVVVLNSQIWHGGTSNQSGNRRLLVQGYFVHEAHAPQQCQNVLLLPETRQRLNKEALKLLNANPE